MATTEELRRQRRGGGPAHVTGSGSSRPLARRLLGPFRRTRGALVADLVLLCAGFVSVAGAAPSAGQLAPATFPDTVV